MTEDSTHPLSASGSTSAQQGGLAGSVGFESFFFKPLPFLVMSWKFNVRRVEAAPFADSPELGSQLTGVFETTCESLKQMTATSTFSSGTRRFFMVF